MNVNNYNNYVVTEATD